MHMHARTCRQASPTLVLFLPYVILMYASGASPPSLPISCWLRVRLVFQSGSSAAHQLHAIKHQVRYNQHSCRRHIQIQ